MSSENRYRSTDTEGGRTSPFSERFCTKILPCIFGKKLSEEEWNAVHDGKGQISYPTDSIKQFKRIRRVKCPPKLLYLSWNVLKSPFCYLIKNGKQRLTLIR